MGGVGSGNKEREKSNEKKGRLWRRKRRRMASVVGFEVVGGHLTRRSRGRDEERGEGNYPMSHNAYMWDTFLKFALDDSPLIWVKNGMGMVLTRHYNSDKLNHSFSCFAL